MEADYQVWVLAMVVGGKTFCLGTKYSDKVIQILIPDTNKALDTNREIGCGNGSNGTNNPNPYNNLARIQHSLIKGIPFFELIIASASEHYREIPALRKNRDVEFWSFSVFGMYG